MNEKSPDRVFIFDTTLRDGEQSPGFHLDANSKLRIARQLGELGVDVAEAAQSHSVRSWSDVHCDRKLGMTRGQVLKRGTEMVSYARSLCDRVQYSPEDAGRADPDYLVETVETMIAAGANVINIPDTTGYCLPWEFGEIVRRAIEEPRGSEKALFSVHCHNDLGLAVANTLAALTAGARRG